MTEKFERKLRKMQEKFGRSAAGTCQNCAHFARYTHQHGRTYSKCKIYGISASEATDWTGKAPACGLYPGKPYNGGAVVREVERKKKQPENIDGQLSLFPEEERKGDAE